jgi:hypothetical protein
MHPYLKYLLIGVVAFLLGLALNNRIGDTNKELSSEVAGNQELFQVPQCNFGRCPEYFSMDVDGDQISESVVIVPTAMTKGAGQVWVIDEGKVVYTSKEYPQLRVEEEGINLVVKYSIGDNYSEEKVLEIKY